MKIKDIEISDMQKEKCLNVHREQRCQYLYMDPLPKIFGTHSGKCNRFSVNLLGNSGKGFVRCPECLDAFGTGGEQ